MAQAAGQVNILIFLMKIKFSPCIPINFVMQGKCLFSDISRPAKSVVICTNVPVKFEFEFITTDIQLNIKLFGDKVNIVNVKRVDSTSLSQLR